MELQNEFTVPAPVSEVWNTLLDVQRIAPCMPGATVERVEGDEVAGRVKVKVGPITASYAGTARFVTKDEAAHRLVLEGSGRETRGSGAASAKVEARMSEDGSGTRVAVVTDLDVSGRAAQFGRGVMADVAAKLTEQFAGCLAERIQEPAGASVASGGQPADGAPAGTGAPAQTAEQAGAGQAPAAPAQAASAFDLIGTVAGPLGKQAAPVVAGLMLGLILGLLFGHRRRVAIVIAPMPTRAVPRPRATL
jgi:carbon monoxide dehydrogenase subunit G